MLRRAYSTSWLRSYVVATIYFIQGTPSLIIGHHLLTGKVVELDKPLAVLAKRHSQQEQSDLVDEMDSHKSGSTEYEIIALVRRKIIFKNRPKPIITSTLPKHT